MALRRSDFLRLIPNQIPGSYLIAGQIAEKEYASDFKRGQVVR